MRVGLGFDQHAASTTEPAGVVFRAVVEALRGSSGLEGAAPEARGGGVEDRAADAAGEGGDAEGERALREEVRLIERHNYQVVNVDISVLSGPLSDGELSAMRERVAKLVHVGPGSVAVKAVREAEVPWLKPAGGVAAVAVTLLDQIADLDALHASIRSGG